MDFFQKQIASDDSGELTFNAAPQAATSNDSCTADVHDTITSLMNMADKMEALLPPECEVPLDIDPPRTSAFQRSAPPAFSAEASNAEGCNPPARPSVDFTNRFADCLSAVSGATASLKTEAAKTEPVPSDPDALALDLSGVPSTAGLSVEFGRSHRPRSLPNTPCYPCNVTDVSGQSGSAPPSASIDAAALGTAAFYRVPPLPCERRSDLSGDPFSLSGSAFASCPSPDMVNTSDRPLRRLFGPSTSPVSVRDSRDMCDDRALDSGRAGMSKSRKTGRKPKTYSKPVASRFCHICSRMPRRGQGSATCRRMAEGFCRKIVCEQCLKEQGWDYEDIRANPASWLCPHCAEICPARSQCHIYNRINARRKRAGAVGTKGGQSVSVAAAIASTDALLGPYGHLFNSTQAVTPQILQPPPNFRLNLPPQYSQH